MIEPGKAPRQPVTLRQAFAGALLVGVAGIGVGYRLDSLALTVAIPLAAMLAYGVIGNAVDKTHIATLQFADSLYYLGFLFTLIALTISLFAIIGESALDVRGVVGRFAVALITTVFGLAARVFLVNFREDLEDSIERSEAALSRTAQSLRARLEEISQDMIGQSQLMNQSLRGSLDRSAQEVDESSARLRQVSGEASDALRASVEAVASELRTSSDGLAQTLRASGEAGADVIREGIEGWTHGVLEAVSALKARAETISVPEELLSRPLGPAVKALEGQLEAAAAGVRRMSEVQEQMGAVAGGALEGVTEAARKLEAASAAIGAWERASRSLEQTAARLEAWGQEVGSATAATSTFATGTREVGKVVEAQGAELAEHARAIAETRRSIEGALAAAKGDLEELSGSLVSAARYIARELKS